MRINWKRPTLAILGAGPKGVAIAAKIHAFASCRWRVPKLVIIERNEIGAHWRGSCGYTDGTQPLCTSPLKDLGYPYLSDWHPDANTKMQAFSWYTFAVDQRRLKEWLESPRSFTHSHLGDYLTWALTKCEVKPLIGAAREIDVADDRWHIPVFGPSSTAPEPVTADGLVITGPGSARRLRIQEDDPSRILDAVTYWYPNNLRYVQELKDCRVAVVGGGGAAASIVVDITERCYASVSIEMLTGSRGVRLQKRQEEVGKLSEDERAWITKTERTRIMILRNLEQAAVSPELFESIQEMKRRERIRERRMYADEVTVMGKKARVVIKDEPRPRLYDLVVVAIGYDAMSFRKLFVEGSSPWVRLEHEKAVAESLGEHLAIEGFDPLLHVPRLAGLKFGPQLSGLTELGNLSDRILSPYTRRRR